jgi:enamine deaminase RidA (YjgF/YER057c/UK114 family)
MPDMPEHTDPAGVAPPVGKYSHLTRVPAGSELLFIAGQVGNDPDGRLPDGQRAASGERSEVAYEQTLRTLANIERILQAADAAPAHLIRLLSFVAGTDALPGYYRARDEVYARWFPDGVYPGHSLAVVAALANPRILVEMEGWAVAPARR